jgi:hypothetical protein
LRRSYEVSSVRDVKTISDIRVAHRAAQLVLETSRRRREVVSIDRDICDPRRVSIRVHALVVVTTVLASACFVGPNQAPPPQRPLGRAGKLEEQTHVDYQPGRTETRSQSVPVTKMVTHYEYRCSMVSRPVQRMETYYESEYDYYSKSTRMVSRTRYVTQYEYQNECRSEPVTRSETSYETKTETRYIPPETHVTKLYDKDTVLIEAEPEILVTPHHRAK